MNDFTVQVASLEGFGLDLQDLGMNFSSNASRMLSELSIPSGTTGLLATLTSSVENLQARLATSYQQDLTSLSSYRSSLSTASRQFQGTDNASAHAISTLAASTMIDQATTGLSEAIGVTRYAGLQLPTLPAIEDSQFTVRKVVDSAIELLAHFDDPLYGAIGIKPTADYLVPLASDWERLEALGSRIRQLGFNDFVASENLSSGVRWLQGSWSGNTAESFATSATALGQALSTRSSDLDVVAKIVTNGGACLERLVYNQAMALSSGLSQPMTFLNFTLPLGGWAQLIDRPMNESYRSQIVTAVDTLKAASAARHESITTMIGKITQALDYAPGGAVPTFSAAEYEVPDKVVVDFGASRYGFENLVWWESTIASPS
ncbi:hypothetical protein [Nocardia shimofusensis]|uniref:hypothetical protein n=1 Tax=Nocardia shimofusensis TaxID=228596 RepID=UPI000831E707|nr:hypothetical protein [Nocardia shimofusensis]